MIPDSVDPNIRPKLLAPEIIATPLLWLCSAQADGVTGKRIVATRWRADPPPAEAAAAAKDGASWP